MATPKLTTDDLQFAKEFWTKVLRQRTSESRKSPDNTLLAQSLRRIREHIAFIDILTAELTTQPHTNKGGSKR